MDVNQDMKPPVARRVPVETTVHGELRVDDYGWLRDRSDPAVIEHLKAENEYMRMMMAHLDGFTDELYREILSRIQETDTSVLVPKGDWWYYSRTQEGLQYPILCRRHLTVDAPEHVYLDQNELASGLDFHALGVADVSEDHVLLAYSEDTTGNESFTLRFRDLSTGELLGEQIAGTYYGSAWANDGRTFYYTVHDSAMRPYRVMRHVVGTDPADDEVVLQEDDPAMHVSVVRQRSGRFVTVPISSAVTCEAWVLDADDPGAEPRLIEPRRHEVEYYVEHHPDRFYIRTNDEGAKNFRLVTAPVEAPGRANWTELIAHRPDVKLAGVDPYRDHLVVTERAGGQVRLRVDRISDGDSHLIEMPEAVYDAWSAPLPSIEGSTMRVGYTSLVTPVSTYGYDMRTRQLTLLKRQPVPGGYDPDVYVTERVWATSEDGTSVPISVVARRDRAPAAPLLLYGYGSYGASIDPYFSPSRVSLLDRGVAFAIAHVRGGGELGEPWHDDGKMLAKRNTFTDFIACADHLAREGWTTHGGLAIMGGSAGGLLVGAVLNMRPDVCSAAVADVPFVDVLNTILDESLPLTVIEWEEWGNPNEREYYDYIRSYSPYDNVAPAVYPDLFVLSGLNDTRVSYWEPAKWVARLRETAAGGGRLLLRTDLESGHGGPSGRYDALREVALKYAFLLDSWGLATR